MRHQIGDGGKIFSFISDRDALHAFKSTTDDYLAERWYRQASSIFVAKDHYIWQRSKHKAPSKRWGNVVQSPNNETQEMLKTHRHRVFEEILDLTEDWRSSQTSSLDAMDGVLGHAFTTTLPRTRNGNEDGTDDFDLPPQGSFQSLRVPSKTSMPPQY